MLLRGVWSFKVTVLIKDFGKGGITLSKKKATSSDVAKRAGVSQATVSMVLNKKYNVSFSRETVEKVEQAARELGYQLPGRKNKKDSKKEKCLPQNLFGVVVFFLPEFY